MPRHKIGDPTTPGLYTQVSWRREGEIPGSTAPGHVQVATICERADTEITNLLDEAVALLSQRDQDLDVDRWMAWVDRQSRFRSELTGYYVTHTPESIDELIKTLHKAKRQAFPPKVQVHTLGGISVSDIDGHAIAAALSTGAISVREMTQD